MRHVQRLRSAFDPNLIMVFVRHDLNTVRRQFKHGVKPADDSLLRRVFGIKNENVARLAGLIATSKRKARFGKQEERLRRAVPMQTQRVGLKSLKLSKLRRMLPPQRGRLGNRRRERLPEMTL